MSLDRIIINRGVLAFVSSHFAGFAPETIRQLLVALRGAAE
jgi:hypothetical protein